MIQVKPTELGVWLVGNGPLWARIPVYSRKDGYYCEACGSDNCPHVEAVLREQPDIVSSG